LVSWRAGLLLLVVLVGLAVYAFVSRPQAAPPAPAFLGCTGLNTVGIRIQGRDRLVEIQRDTPRDPWRLTQPQQAAADLSSADYLMSEVAAVKVLNTVPGPRTDPAYGLAQPRETLTCRVNGGASYNLSVGNQSFDGSGYYAQKMGDSRVYVISGVEVDEFDRALAEPPVKPSPSPTT
jgi:hypothetical protein